MVLQTLFALYSMFPGAVPGNRHESLYDDLDVDRYEDMRDADPYEDMVFSDSIRSNSSVTLAVGRHFTAEVFPAKPALSATTRYPGAVVIATDETRDRAFLLGNRLSEIGVTTIIYIQERNATHRYRVFDAITAVDSLRRRSDVRPEEVGVVAFDEATSVVPDLVRDTTLHFAIAATSKESVRELATRYTKARAATLLLQGVDHLEYGGIPLINSVTQGSDIPPVYIAPPVLKTKELPKEQVKKIKQLQIAPNVTVWPVPREQLEGIGEAQSTLGTRVVGWVREQVHARSGSQQTEYSLGRQ